VKKLNNEWMLKVLVLLTVVVFTVNSNSFAQTDQNVHELDEVVVTATHKMKVVDTPASISIITADELSEMGAKNISEALKKIPGVIDTTSHDDSISVRGMKSAMAGGPVILIDGIPQKVGDYRYDQFSFIPVSQIERIEVLRSAGIVYGPGSARGVINVITKKSLKEKAFSGSISGSYGSWKTHNENAAFNGMINQFDYLVNASNYGTDGYEEEPQDRTSVLLKLGYNFSEKTRLGVRGSFTTNDKDFAYGFSKYKYQLENYRRNSHFPKSETDSRLVWHNTKEQDVSTYAIEFSQKGEKHFLDSLVSWTNYQEKYTDSQDIYTSASSYRGDIDDKDQDTYTFNLSGGYNYDFGGVYYTPSVGLNVEDIHFENRKTYPYGPNNSTAASDFDIDERLYGFFWDNDFFFGEKWGLKIGGRVDTADITYEDKVPNKIEGDQQVYSWQVAPSYHLSNNGNVYISAGRNYWFPTPRYYAWAALYGGNDNRPEDLKPEESLTYEVGYKHRIHKMLNIAVTGFFTEYKDKMDSLYDSNQSWKGIKNIGDAESMGIELEADGRLCPYFGYRLAGSFIDIEWTSGQMRVYDHPSNTRVMRDLAGHDIDGIPNYTYLLGLDFYLTEGLKCSIDINGTGPYYLDYLNRLEYEAKATVDANISYRIKNWKFWILGKNILDEEIERPINSTGQLTAANGEPKNAYYVLDGLYVEAGISYHF